MAKRTYTQEEVEAILDRAIRQQSKDASKLTHDELVSAAAEVGIPKEAIDTAARELGEPAKSPARSDEQIVSAWRKRAWRAFIRHFVTFVLVNAMLAFINLATSRAFLWFPIVILGWGIGVSMQLLGILFADEERIVARERRRLEKRERRERWKAKGDDFEKAVSEGVQFLLDAANKQDRARIAPPTRVARTPEEQEPEDEPEDEDHHARGR